MHGELVGRTFHNAELELNPDFVVYIARIFCVQIIDFHAETVARGLCTLSNNGECNSNREIRKFEEKNKRENTVVLISPPT